MSQIFVFASIYDSMQGHFYAPYAKNEVSSNEDRNMLIKTLTGLLAGKIQEAIENDQKSVRTSSGTDENRRYPVLGWSGLTSITFDDDQSLHFKGQFNSHYSKPLDVSGHFYIPQTYFSSKSDVYSTWVLCTYNNFITIAAYFEKREERHFSFRLDLDHGTLNMIALYRNGVQGDPTTLSRSWFRMLYFSAVVNTTVGFGDIVPMTDAARALSALQAVLGITWVGLFFNAAARPGK